MQYPEILWRPSASEIGKSDLNPVRFFRTNSQSGLASSFNWTTPGPSVGRIRIVSGCHIFSAAGGAQNATGSEIQLVSASSGAGLMRVLAEWFTARPTMGINFNPSDGFILMADEALYMSAYFSAGAVANNVTFNIWGIDLPAGNWQRG